MSIEKYVKHLSTCNKMQNWDDAFDALSRCEDVPEKELEYNRMRHKQNTCTCGLEDELKTVSAPSKGKYSEAIALISRLKEFINHEEVLEEIEQFLEAPESSNTNPNKK